MEHRKPPFPIRVIPKETEPEKPMVQKHMERYMELKMYATSKEREPVDPTDIPNNGLKRGTTIDLYVSVFVPEDLIIKFK
jgi:hypothetical protein